MQGAELSGGQVGGYLGGSPAAGVCPCPTSPQARITEAAGEAAQTPGAQTSNTTHNCLPINGESSDKSKSHDQKQKQKQKLSRSMQSK